MEAARDFIPFEGYGQGTDPAPASGVDGALAVLRDVSATAVEDAASWGLKAASDFAGLVEELSRTAEYLQVVAASAVDRARKQSAADAGKAGTAWTTGWREDAGVTGGEGASPGAVEAPVDDGYRNTAEFLRARLLISAAEARRRLTLAERLLPRRGLAGQPVPAVHEELGAAVAAGEVASRAATVITLALEKVRHACDAEALARMEHALTRTAAENDADFLIRVARGWTDAIDQDGAEPSEELLRQLQGAFIRRRRHGLHHVEIFATTEQFEHLLTVMNTATNPRTGTTATAAANDAEAPATSERSAAASASGEDLAAATATGWSGASFTATGWSPASGDESAAGTAIGWGSGAGESSAIGWGSAAGTASNDVAAGGAAGGVSACDSRPAVATVAGVPAAPASEDHPLSEDHAASADHADPVDDPGAVGLDLRSRPQRLLDGLVGACKLALATGQLPAAGGLRPQVMVTIDYRDLLTRLGTHPADMAGAAGAAGGPDPAPQALQHTGTLQRTGALEQTGSLLFTGPVTASTVRKIACDADIIPVLLGGQGRILDIGRASRLFPPHLRKALIARDRGCAFPGCTIPAPWCEAHHITYWSRGGTSGTDNGALLCSHHHHVIHKEHWTIQLRTGVPWFIPPPHLDPHQRPRRNHYFKPADLTTAA